MTHALTTVAAAVAVFAGTNIDDLIVLTVLFLSGRAGGIPKTWQIWAGQYAGIGALIAISVIGAAGLTLVPDRWVGLLGLIPFALGVRALFSKDEQPKPVAGSVLAIAGVTIANGADNISVYTPMFRTIGWADSLITIIIFLVLVAAWCLTASWLGSHQRVVPVIERYGHWLVPVVFMAVGAVIFAGVFV